MHYHFTICDEGLALNQNKLAALVYLCAMKASVRIVCIINRDLHSSHAHSNKH